MLYVYTSEYVTASDPEFTFNQRIPGLTYLTASMERCLREYDRAELIGKNQIRTPYGVGTLRDLSIACKLALSMQLYPSRLFRVYGCSESQLVKILNEENGKLLFENGWVFSGLKRVNFLLDNTVQVLDTSMCNLLLSRLVMCCTLLSK